MAWRTFHPRKPIAPDLVAHPLRLPYEISQVMLSNVISLLPGSLCVDIGKDDVVVHVLDGRKNYNDEFAALEKQITRLVGVTTQPISNSTSKDGG